MNNEFIERMIYECEKDNPFKNIKSFYKAIFDKYKVKPSSDLYKKIVNYQIDFYGSSLTYDDKEKSFRSNEDMRKITDEANARRYSRKKRKRK